MYVLGLGSNMGDRLASMRGAARLLAVTGDARVLAESAVYETEPVGPPQPCYLNAALRIQSELEPEAMLRLVLRIEAQLGRDRSTGVRWGPRVIDIDLLFWSEGSFSSAVLQLPHPELSRRGFALAPLLDVAPELGERYAEVLLSLGGDPPRHLPTLAAPSPIEDPGPEQ